jgi:hypothetical protein
MRRSKSEVSKTVSFSQFINKKKTNTSNKKDSILEQVNERRVSNFGGAKNELTAIKKLKLIQNYQQSYSRQKTPDDSMLVINGRQIKTKLTKKMKKKMIKKK